MNQNIQLYRQEQQVCLNNWLYNNRSREINCYFISTLNNVEDLSIIRIPEIEQDVICYITHDKYLKLGELIKVEYDGFSERNNHPRLKICTASK